MGRLKSWQAFNPLFSGKYKKLFEDYSSKDYSKLLLQETTQDSLSYNCNHCGHVQRLEAEELNAIVGHAFRLAYAAHLQKSTGAALRDVSCNAPSDQLHFVSSHSKSTPSSSLSSSVCRSHTVHKSSSSKACSHPTTSGCSQHHYSSSQTISSSSSLASSDCCSHLHSCKQQQQQQQNSAVTHCSSSLSQSHQQICDSSIFNHCEKLELDEVDNSKKTESSQESNESSLERSNPPLIEMRTPGHSPAITRHHRQTALNSCSFKPPTSLPLLHYSDHENNLLHTPDSDTSNSPTELNTTKRLVDKPPLIKNVNLSNDSNITFDEDFGLNITTCGTPRSTNSLNSSNSSSGNSFTPNGGLSVGGYINERLNSEKGNDIKCRLQDEMTLKRISQLSICSSGHPHETLPLDISSHSCTPPPLPERSDSLTPPEEPHLKAAAWFQAGIPREIALEVLSREPVGAFMVRESTSKPGCYALSLRVPRDFTVSGIAHYLIVKTNKGYKIKGFTKEFITLTALITHHSVMPELLPCPLSLSRYNPTFTTEDSNRNDSNDDDPDYNTLSDFRKMMADLNV